MIELVRLGTTSHVATSRKLKAEIVTARLALASGYQSLLRTIPSPSSSHFSLSFSLCCVMDG